MGYQITSVAGASIGALIGGFYAAGQLDHYADWVSSLDRMDIFSLMDFNFRSQGFIKGKKVFKQMEEWIRDEKIENLSIPFTAIATDIVNRREVVITQGNLLSAIRASVAVPGVLMPMEENGRYLFDGGVSNPIPVNRVHRNGDELLLAIDLNAFGNGKSLLLSKKSIKDPKTQPGNLTRFDRLKNKFQDTLLPSKPGKGEAKTNLSYFSILNNMFDMMQEEISTFVLQQYPPDVLVKIPRDVCSTFEFHRSKELIEIGRQALRKALLSDQSV